MTVYRFRATPLTPIHVGNGETLAPEDYVLDEQNDLLIHFNRAGVLRDMDTAARQYLEQRLDRNDFQATQEILRKHVKPQHHISRIQISAESKDDLRKAVSNPLDPVVRQRAVHGFVRNPLTGRPYLPGSAIKGAIRTAIVNIFAQRNLPNLKQTITPLLRNNQDRQTAWRILETQALNFEFRQLQEDPFRLCKIADADLPDNSTRIDKVWPVKRDGNQDTKGIQMHYERLLSRSDDGQSDRFSVEVVWDDRTAAYHRVRIGRRLDIETIRIACNLFYTERILAEQQRFFVNANPSEQVFGAQGLLQIQSDKVLVAKKISERGLLLRVGRFSHFESLSVDGLRQGWNIQKKQSITEGSTRTLCRARPDNSGQSVPVPFGWLLLELK